MMRRESLIWGSCGMRGSCFMEKVIEGVFSADLVWV